MFRKLLTNKKIVFISLTLYWVLIAAATSIPSSSMPKTSLGDKYQHFLAYFGLGFLLYLTLLLQDKYQKLKASPGLYAFILTVIYAALDEIHQLYVPGRYGDVLDFTADAAGAAAGILLIKYFYKKLTS